jgi:hypothetical protein
MFKVSTEIQKKDLFFHNHGNIMDTTDIPILLVKFNDYVMKSFDFLITWFDPQSKYHQITILKIKLEIKFPFLFCFFH